MRTLKLAKRRQAIGESHAPKCPHCNTPGNHYIPAQYGMPNFWLCPKYYGKDGVRINPDPHFADLHRSNALGLFGVLSFSQRSA